MTKFILFPLFFLFLSLNSFSQETIDDEIFTYINYIRKDKKSNQMQFDSCLHKVSKDYALFVREYFNNNEFKNLKFGVKKMFFNTEDVYCEMVDKYVENVTDNINQFYIFIASKNKFYSEKEISDLVVSSIVSEKSYKYGVFYEEYEKMGISCVYQESLKYKQIIICIISCQ